MSFNVMPARNVQQLADEANERDALLYRIDQEIKAAAQAGQYTITVDVESRVQCKDEVMGLLREAGYTITGTRGVKTFRIAWK